MPLRHEGYPNGCRFYGSLDNVIKFKQAIKTTVKY